MDLNSHVVDYGGTMSPGEFVEVQSIYEPNFDSSITASVFDPHQELFWTGNNEVRYGNVKSLARYSAFT